MLLHSRAYETNDRKEIEVWLVVPLFSLSPVHLVSQYQFTQYRA